MGASGWNTVTFDRQDWKNSSNALLTWPGDTLIGTTSNTYTEIVSAEILKSVINNGGFYIARYEAENASDVARKEGVNVSDAATLYIK